MKWSVTEAFSVSPTIVADYNNWTFKIVPLPKKVTEWSKSFAKDASLNTHILVSFEKKEWTEKMLPYVFILHFLVTFHIDDANKSANPTTNLCSSFLDLNNWEKINQYHFWSFTSKADLLFCSWFQFNKTVKDKDILKLLFSWL